MKTIKFISSLVIMLAGILMVINGLEDETFSTESQLLQDGGAILSTIGFLCCYNLGKQETSNTDE